MTTKLFKNFSSGTVIENFWELYDMSNGDIELHCLIYDDAPRKKNIFFLSRYGIGELWGLYDHAPRKKKHIFFCLGRVSESCVGCTIMLPEKKNIFFFV
jgi:hypothetical protein